MKFQRLSFVVGIACAFAPMAAFAQTTDNAVLQWSGANLEAIRNMKVAPTMCARSLGIVDTCMFDAWAAYDSVAVGTRLGASLRRPAYEATEANKAQAISFSAYRCLVDLFPSELPLFNKLMASLGYDSTDASFDLTTAIGVGNATAAAVLEFRHHDGSNQLGDLNPGAYSDYTGYVPVNTPTEIIDPNRWQPLSIPNGAGGFTVQKFATPQFGKVIPFSLSSGAQLVPSTGPAQYPSWQYYISTLEVIGLSASLGDREKVIAEYWADGPHSELPPGHWHLFGAAVSRRDHHTIDDDAKLFLALGNAVLDAAITAWDSKRKFDSVRPITAVHYLTKGRKIRAWAGPYKGARWIAGETWQPYQPANVVTPPFPEYLSGHSMFSASSAEILKRFTGSDVFNGSAIVRAGSSLVEPGAVPAHDMTLSWPTFSDAADQAGISRRYGGIHFFQGDIDSRLIGRKVGEAVWNRAQSYINGTALN